MNYNSQLKGWAVDRVIELCKASNSAITVGNLKELADELVAYAYSPQEDFRDSVKRMIEVLKASTPEDALLKVQELSAELAYIEEDLRAKKAMRDTLPTELKAANDPAPTEAQ